MKPMLEEYNVEVAGPSKIRNIIKHAIEFLIEKRVEMENANHEKINWNEELLARINGLHHQLTDIQMEEVTVFKNSFHTIKNEVSQKMMSKIPEILRTCSELVTEESDFGKLGVDLNEEMNRRIADYMANTALYDFKHAVQGWIEDCEREFKDSQIKLDEMSESFTRQYFEEKIVLDCDFKILDDWRRDMERISRGMVHVEKVNIMMRNNPSQLLLKGAGKLLGSISKNKERLHTRFKSYVENEDYSHIAQEIINPFLQQLELFEGSIEWDISKFLATPFEVLNRVSENVQGDIEKHKDSLDMMREKPEIYRDPLTLFEVKLCQYELVNMIS